MADPAFVQGKGTNGPIVNSHADATLTIDAAPTQGNCLIMLAAGPIGAGDLVIDPYWTLIGSLDTSTYTNGQGNTSNRGFYFHVVGAGESASLPMAHNNNVINSSLITDIVEYANLGPVPTFTNPTWSDMASGSATNYPLPSQTPIAGFPVLLIGGWEVIPNYSPAAPAGWTMRASTNLGGSRQSTAIVEQVISAPDGTTSYDGNATGAGGETAWHTFSVVVGGTTASGGSQVVII